MNISGVHTALITPFKNNQVDYEGLKQLIHLQVTSGVEGVVTLGTTAETPTLTDAEKEKIARLSIEESKSKVSVMVGVGTNATATTVANAKKAQRWGADSLLVVTPYYNKPTQNGIFQHFKAVSEESDLPLIVYNIPGRCGTNIEVETLNRIIELGTVCGVKEASGNLSQITETLALAPPEVSIMSGDDTLTFAVMTLGGKGVISVLSNLFPDRIVHLTRLIQEKKWDEARTLHFELLPFFKALFLESNPLPIKELMNYSHLPSGGCRLPMCEMEPHNKESLYHLLKTQEVANA